MTSDNIFNFHIFIGFVCNSQVPRSIGHTVSVIQGSGHNCGIRITGKRFDLGLLSRYYQNLESLSGQRVHEKTFLKLIDLEKALPDAMETADLLRILYNWLRETVQPRGYPCQEVFSLCTWILEQMGTVPGISNRFQKALKKAGKHLPDVLGYLKRIESSLREYACDKGIPENIMLLLYRMRSYPEGSVQQKAADRKLRRTLGSHYEDIRREADILLNGIKRASSMVENLNGRLRRYMNLKRIIPERFLTLLKVYFNTRPYRRSRKKEREGKSPLELLTGQKHPDFYETTSQVSKYRCVKLACKQLYLLIWRLSI